MKRQWLESDWAVFLPAVVLLGSLLGSGLTPVASQGQGKGTADVYLNVLASGGKKINLVITNFTQITAAPDPIGFHRLLPEIITNDLKFSGYFSVISTGEPPPATLKEAMTGWAQTGAHAAIEGRFSMEGRQLVMEARLYDLTSPDFRLLTGQRYTSSPNRHRQIAHKFSDEVVLQFTGEPGIAQTKIAYVSTQTGSKEIYVMDYDGFNPFRLTQFNSISLLPSWSPDGRSIAFTSYQHGQPYLYRLFPFQGRQELLSGWPGINSAAAWSPDGKQVALTLSKDGNPEIYLLSVGTANIQRLTNFRGIDTSPSWSPTGREIAFTSDRAGIPQIFVMDAEGASVRRVTYDGIFKDQARWSPKGDLIAYTAREGGFNIWVVNADASNPRRLTANAGSNESASWSPDGRHLVFSSNRTGRWQLYTMFADGSEQQQLTRDRGEVTNPSWSPRIP